jgi:hypothetical protein
MWRFGLSLLAYPAESKGVSEDGKKEYGENGCTLLRIVNCGTRRRRVVSLKIRLRITH